MKTPQSADSARQTTTSPKGDVAITRPATDSISDPWRSMIELIAKQLAAAWAKESAAKNDLK